MGIIKCKVLQNCSYSSHLFLVGDIVYIGEVGSFSRRHIFDSGRKLICSADIEEKHFDIYNPIP